MFAMLKSLFDTDFSLTITSIIALSALFSPIIVAIINNIHHSKIRKLELHNEMEQKQFDVYYSDKVKAFTDLTTNAGKLITEIGDNKSYTDVYIYFHNALLLCNETNQSLINNLMQFINTQLFSGQKPTIEWENTYLSKLSELTLSLNSELATTADAIQRLHHTKRKLQKRSKENK